MGGVAATPVEPPTFPSLSVLGAKQESLTCRGERGFSCYPVAHKLGEGGMHVDFDVATRWSPSQPTDSPTLIDSRNPSTPTVLKYVSKLEGSPGSEDFDFIVGANDGYDQTPAQTVELLSTWRMVASVRSVCLRRQSSRLSQAL